MIPVMFSQVNTILCLGSHADDIEIGCGGTILKILRENRNVDVHWVVLSGDGQRAEEASQSARQFLGDAESSTITQKRFRDSYFPYTGEAIKEYFFELASDIQPDIVFTHRREDLHQDHRLVSELTWNTFRNHLILEYEIPKYDGDLGNPNVFVPLSQATCEKKVNTIYNTFHSQQQKPWFTADTFWSVLRLRGIESNSPTNFAEGLYCRKMIL